mmetsp:Transcript_9781/g.18920  ORF Transcript_9781/g.18920 Transcript_9781/m.18920 type:complete len:248 (-) Transcript_9781:131-874(-)
MLPRPAEHCCGACPLLQGVQIVASYTVVVGMFSLLSLLMRGPAAKHPGPPEMLLFVEWCQTFIHTVALFAGLKGLIGVMFRDPARLRTLLRYHIAELVVSSVGVVLKEVEACEELRKLRQIHKSPKIDCTSARVLLMVEFAIHAFLFSYFAFVIWSLIARLEAGELGVRPPLLDPEHELADRSGFSDVWPLGRTAGDGNSLWMQRVPLSGGPSAAAGPQPFSGAPRTLSDQQAVAPEPFHGTAHRLE